MSFDKIVQNFCIKETGSKGFHWKMDFQKKRHENALRQQRFDNSANETFVVLRKIFRENKTFVQTVKVDFR